MTNPIDFFTAAASANDTEVRQRGISFVDGSIPGYALLMGNDVATVKPILEELTKRKILVFIVEEALSAELKKIDFPVGWGTGVVSLDLTQALGFIFHTAQVFGNADNTETALDYARQRLRGFTLLLGKPTPERLQAAQTALPLGCPLLSTTDLPSSVNEWAIPADYRSAIGNFSTADILQAAIEERGLQIHVPLPELPVGYSPDFSGQIVRDEICGACFTGVELVVTGQDIVDGRVFINGFDLDSVSDTQPYAMLIEVSGRMMQPDFESVLERQIETILNDMDGITHRGQRTIVTLRASQKSVENGLRFHHIGEILHARLHNEFGNILSRVQITITTEPEQIQAIRERAQAIYQQRDQRLSSLMDEEIDTFYTCNLCQTIAAGHLCVISPERPGTCGAVDWMDARAAVSIKPVGSNKAVQKNGLLDARLGQWESVNQIVTQESGGALAAYSLYSLMQDPGSACGDFECITAMLPLSNGVMIVDRNYVGMTPSGMDWNMLYEMVGMGTPVPGFMGHSKRALQREKFISAEGGWQRIVWINHALREQLRPMLEAHATVAGIPNFVDMIATEQNALTEDEILVHLELTGHPALAMEPMI